MGIIAAALLLCRARFLVAAVKFGTWRKTLGTPWTDREQSRPDKAEAKRQAVRIERAAQLLPFHMKCLPRAMALSWVLRDRMIRHSVVFAVRPAQFRGSLDDLHVVGIREEAGRRSEIADAIKVPGGRLRVGAAQLQRA